MVRLGALNLDSRLAKDFVIEKFIKHDAYNSYSKENDIALLKLSREVPLTDPSNIRPACLWDKDNIGQMKTIATGYGFTQHAGKTSKDLMKVQLDLHQINQCQRIYEDDDELVINNNQICAGDLKGGKDTCQGGNIELEAKRKFSYFMSR